MTRIFTLFKHPPHVSYPIFNWVIITLLFFCTLAINGQNAKKQLDKAFAEATILTHKNDLSGALNALKKAENIAEIEEDLQGIIDTYHKYGLLYLELKDQESTEFYWSRAKVFLKDNKYLYGEAVHKYLEAKILENQGNYFAALAAVKEVKKLSNDKNLINNTNLLEGLLLVKIGKLQKAEVNFNALLVNSDTKERDFLKVRGNLALSEVKLKEGNIQKAVKYAKDALHIAKSNKFYQQELIANKTLGEIYKSSGDYAQAYDHQNALIALKDSVFTIEKLQIESKLGNREKQKSLTETVQKLQAQNDQLIASKGRSEMTAILTSAFLMLISILAVTLYRNNRIKLQTNDLLKIKNQDLEKAKDEAIMSAKAKTNFLSTVTHELRTPLYAVTGLTNILLEENPGKHQVEHLKSLKYSGDYLLNFINDILQINKIDADKVEPMNIEFQLKKMLSEVMDSLQQQAKDNNTKVILDYDNSIPLHVSGDPLKLSQVIMNLLGNALKFTKDGQVEIIAKLKEQDGENLTIYFEVADTGIGISEEKQKNIFDSFEQGSIQINREYGGTGLGLSIVKSLLGLFGSQIACKSKLGEGSSFFFEMKMRSPERHNYSISDDAQIEQDYNFEGLHVLVVEDNKINQVITKKMLNKKGITCDIANNGNEAIDAATENQYAVILMDIHMPGISGTEATKQIRKFDPDTPIIALTAISMEDSVEEFIEAGCNAVVTKPFKPEVFYNTIGEKVFGVKLLEED